MMRLRISSCGVDHLLAADFGVIHIRGEFVAVMTADEKSVTVVRAADGRVTRERCHMWWLAVRAMPEKVEVTTK